MYKRIVLCLFLCLILLPLYGCDPEKEHITETLFAMDTVMTIELYGKDAKQAYHEIADKILEIETYSSAVNPNSEISRLNKEKYLEANEDVLAMIKTAVFFGEQTNGALDISTHAAVETWGFGGGTYRVPSDLELEELIKSIDYRKIRIEGNTITIPEEMTVGLGAVAKGYCADLAVEIAKKHGVDFALINLGGNIACYGKPLNSDLFGIGVEDPYQPGTALAVIQTTDRSLVSSGNYQRFFEQDGTRYHHIIDPETAAPVDTDINMVTVVCKDSTTADCLSTSLYVMGEEKTVEYWRNNKDLFEFVMVKDDELLCSKGLKNKFNPLIPMDILWID